MGHALLENATLLLGASSMITFDLVGNRLERKVILGWSHLT
jgi:hypothetical protein